MIAAWNRKLNPSGIYVTILRTRGQRSLIYIYRPKKLKRNLTTVRAQVLLKRFGYRSLEIEDALFRLRGRLLQKRIFPMKLACSLVILLKMWKDLSPTVAKGVNALVAGKSTVTWRRPKRFLILIKNAVAD